MEKITTVGLNLAKQVMAVHGVGAEGERVSAPTGYVEFPAEILRPPRSVAENVYNIQRWTKKDKGGHFAALEQPEALVDEIREFFRPLRG